MISSYLSILLHRHIIQARKKYTKKCVNLRQKKLNRSKWAHVLYAKRYTGSKKSTPSPVVAVLTNMSYADALGKLFTITENKTGHPKLKRQALFKDDEMSTNFCLNRLPSFCNNDDVIYKKR